MGRPRKADDGIIKYEVRCKVCNSHFKNMIEALYVNNLNPRQIFEALNSLTDTASQKILQQEQLTESAIARHLDRHFSIKAGAALQQAKTQDRIQKSRELFKDGVQNKINTISTLSHLIDVALINIESLDSLPDGRQRHQLTINYMGQIKSLIDEFSKLTGELQVENTFDINFWNIQISEFANIVMQVIRHMDHKFQLNSQLEYNFGIEFQKQWKQYKETQNKILNGELPADYGAKERSLNTFNITPKYDNDDTVTSEELIDGETLTINNVNNNHLLSTNNPSINNLQINNINSEIEEDLPSEQNKPFNSLRQDYSEQYITDDDDDNNGNEYNKENFNSTLDQNSQQNNNTSQSNGDPYFLNNYYSSYLTEDNEAESEEEKNYNNLHKQYTEQTFNNNVIDNQLQADSYLQDAMKKPINANQILSTDQYAEDYNISFSQQKQEQENNYLGDTSNGNFGTINDNNYGNITSNNSDVVKNNLSKMAAVQQLLRKRNQLQNSYLTDLNQSNANNNANKDFTNAEFTNTESINENENDQESILIKSKRKVPDNFKLPKPNKELTKQLHNFFRK